MDQTSIDRAKKNVELLQKYLEQKDVLYARLKSIVQSKKKVKGKFHKILTLQGDIEYIRRLICHPEYGVYPTCPDVPSQWHQVSSIQKFF